MLQSTSSAFDSLAKLRCGNLLHLKTLVYRILFPFTTSPVSEKLKCLLHNDSVCFVHFIKYKKHICFCCNLNVFHGDDNF